MQNSNQPMNLEVGTQRGAGGSSQKNLDNCSCDNLDSYTPQTEPREPLHTTPSSMMDKAQRYSSTSSQTITCTKCGKATVNYSSICRHCGKPHGAQVVSTLHYTARSQKDSSTNQADVDATSLLLTIICAVLWMVTPFIAINLLTLGEQPTALQFIIDDITYLGELTETSAFWAALGSLIGIISCIICICRGRKGGTRISALLAEIPMVIAFMDMISLIDDVDMFFGIFGLGFWGIAILFAVLACISRK